MGELFPDVEWCADATARVAGCIYNGPLGSVEVTLSGGPAGVYRYGVVLRPGAAPVYQAGAMPDADASYDQAWPDAVAQLAGAYDPAVGFMQGNVKTKGATRPLFELFQWWARADVRAALAGIDAGSNL